MTGIINQTGAKSGVIGTISGLIETGGKVLFKSTGKASGNPDTGKTWVAFGSGEYAEPHARQYTGGSPDGVVARGYGYGDCISVNAGSGFVDDLPSNVSSVNWQFTLEYDDA